MGIGGIVNGVRETWRSRTKAREELEVARQNLTKKEIAAMKLKGGRTWLGLGKKEQLRTAGHAHRRTTMIDASNYAERMDRLLQKINDPALAAEKRKLNEKHLYRLLQMAEEHMAEGLVNFGKGYSRLATSFEFINQLSHAQVELTQKGFFKEPVAKPELYTFGGKEKISIEQFMNKKTERLSKEEKKFITRGLLRGLAVGAVAGGVGAAFGGWLREQYGNEIQEWISATREKVGMGGGKTPGFDERTLAIIGDSPTPKPPKNLPVMERANEGPDALRKAMEEEDVIGLHNLFRESGIEIWIDGGWGIDALLEKQTRTHGDLDIAVNKKDVAKLRNLLTKYQEKPEISSEKNFV